MPTQVQTTDIRVKNRKKRFHVLLAVPAAELAAEMIGCVLTISSHARYVFGFRCFIELTIPGTCSATLPAMSKNLLPLSKGCGAAYTCFLPPAEDPGAISLYLSSMGELR